MTMRDSFFPVRPRIRDMIGDRVIFYCASFALRFVIIGSVLMALARKPWKQGKSSRCGDADKTTYSLPLTIYVRFFRFNLLQMAWNWNALPTNLHLSSTGAWCSRSRKRRKRQVVKKDGYANFSTAPMPFRKCDIAPDYEKKHCAFNAIRGERIGAVQPSLRANTCLQKAVVATRFASFCSFHCTDFAQTRCILLVAQGESRNTSIVVADIRGARRSVRDAANRLMRV